MNWLKGKKTYIVALVAGVLAAAVQLGFIDVALSNQVLLFVVSTLGVTLRMAIASKNE